MHPALRVVCLSLLLAAAFAGEPQKILMIGNSLTYTWGIPKVLESFAAATKRTLSATAHTTGGKSLTWHWTNPSKPSDLTAQDALKKGGYDLVVVQEFSNLMLKKDNAGEFAAIVPEYHKLITGGGMRMMLYMAHPTAKEVGAQPAADQYTAMADQLGVVCAPVILAFQRCAEKQPGIALLDVQAGKYAQNKVGTHQSPYGSYLAACVLFAAIYNQSPVGIGFHAVYDAKKELPIEAADAKAAQEIAWAVWQEYAAKRPAPKSDQPKKR